MKTAEQFLQECKEKWSLDNPINAKSAMIEALKLYAEQAIDECAKSATTYTLTFGSSDKNEWDNRVDTSSILKVKQMLE